MLRKSDEKNSESVHTIFQLTAPSSPLTGKENPFIVESMLGENVNPYKENVLCKDPQYRVRASFQNTCLISINSETILQ